MSILNFFLPRIFLKQISIKKQIFILSKFNKFNIENENLFVYFHLKQKNYNLIFYIFFFLKKITSNVVFFKKPKKYNYDFSMFFKQKNYNDLVYKNISTEKRDTKLNNNLPIKFKSQYNDIFLSNNYLLNNLVFFLRKIKIFNKGRYSRNRQIYRTGVYLCLWLNIIVIVGIYFIFYRFLFNFGYLWWIFFFFVSIFFFSKFFNYNLFLFNHINKLFTDYYYFLLIFLKNNLMIIYYFILKLKKFIQNI